MASNPTANCLICPGVELVRDLMPVQTICKFAPDKIEYGVFGTKGQVTPKSPVRSGLNSNLFEILCLSRLSASLIKIELGRDFMVVLVTSKFEDDSIDGGGTTLRTTFSPSYVYGKMFHCSRASKSEVNSSIWPEIEFIREFMPVLTKIRLKLKSLSSGQHFLHYKSTGAIGCRGNSNFNPICPRAFYLSSNPVMLHMKFDQDWPTQSYSSLKVWTTTDDGRTVDHWYTACLQLRWA